MDISAKMNIVLPIYYNFYFRRVGNSAKDSIAFRERGFFVRKRFFLTPEERVRVCKYCSKNMRKMRKEIGIPQGDLATALGTTQRRLSEIENGKATVSWTLMLAFSTFLVQFPQLREIEEENAIEGVSTLRIMMTSLKSGL